MLTLGRFVCPLSDSLVFFLALDSGIMARGNKVWEAWGEFLMVLHVAVLSTFS